MRSRNRIDFESDRAEFDSSRLLNFLEDYILSS